MGCLQVSCACCSGCLLTARVAQGSWARYRHLTLGHPAAFSQPFLGCLILNMHLNFSGMALRRPFPGALCAYIHVYLMSSGPFALTSRFQTTALHGTEVAYGSESVQFWERHTQLLSSANGAPAQGSPLTAPPWLCKGCPWQASGALTVLGLCCLTVPGPMSACHNTWHAINFKC